MKLEIVKLLSVALKITSSYYKCHGIEAEVFVTDVSQH